MPSRRVTHPAAWSDPVFAPSSGNAAMVSPAVRDSGSVGYVVANVGLVNLYVDEIGSGETGPTAADMIAGRRLGVVPPGTQWFGESETAIVYVCAASGTGSARFRELMGR